MPNRRHFLKTVGAAAFPLLPAASVFAAPPARGSFVYCLNTSTIRGHNLGLSKELETVSKAGFRSVEIWMDTLQAYLEKGGTTAQVRRMLSDLGLTCENAIGFAPWIVDDDAARAKGLDQLKREMELLAQIGCRRTAAPPIGAHQSTDPKLDLKYVAERYRAALEIGVQTGVVPQLELWGFAQNLSRLSEVMYVATECGHPAARVLLDVYHLYKGGSSLDALPLVGKPGVEIFHVNDYPAHLTPAAITDADRVYPGDGVAPLARIAQAIRNPDRPVVLSFEVFNKTYYAQDPLLVARTALQKMKAAF
ncbi:MAG: sugar phosphate isomerase/epimerase [Cytophagales bacterium]|jgi:sugar phosphate isomerase/epimerase|nr:sugar phosphate isomerase/epimerase [Cytophagales bacterium]